MKNEGKICDNHLCQEAAHCSGLCRRCYQRIQYWKKKPARDLVRRRQTLALWAETVEHLIPQIRPIPKRKRA